jgi:hypothetical protein
VPIVLKSGSLNLLEPSGSVKACNGIALPLLYTAVQLMDIVAVWLMDIVSFRFLQDYGMHCYAVSGQVPVGNVS